MKIGVIINTIKFIYAQTGTEIKKNYVCQDDIIDIINPLDELALEYALGLKDRHTDVSVVVLGLGDKSAENGLRKGLAVGADRAVHILCDDCQALDSFASSAALSAACKREKFDVILCGAARISDNDCTEGSYVAGRLGIPHITGVVTISVGPGTRSIEVQRVIERGDRQIMECDLPALLTIQKGEAVVPRYPTLAGTLRAESSPITLLSLQDLGFKGVDSLLSLCMTETTAYSGPKPKKKRDVLQVSRLSAAQRIDLMVNRDMSREKQGGNILEGVSDEMFARLDTILTDAGIYKE